MDKLNLFKDGAFISHSGCYLEYKLECDALSDEDITTLAKIIRKRVPKFNRVVGIPGGGLRLQEALKPDEDETSDWVLVVDDVLTTGKSMEEYMSGHGSLVYGAVIFNRSGVRIPNVYSLFIESI